MEILGEKMEKSDFFESVKEDQLHIMLKTTVYQNINCRNNRELLAKPNLCRNYEDMTSANKDI